MSKVIHDESVAFQDAWEECDSALTALRVLGLALRRASGNPEMRQFRETAGESAFSAYYEELHPLTDTDIDYVMGKLAWQARQVESRLPKLPYSRYKEARALVAEDPQLQRYVERVNSASQSAWSGARYLYGLEEGREDAHATDFVRSVRHLGIPGRELHLKVLTDLVLSCRPSYLQAGKLRMGNGLELDNYTNAYMKTFGHKLITVLHTRVPTG